MGQEYNLHQKVLHLQPIPILLLISLPHGLGIIQSNETIITTSQIIIQVLSNKVALKRAVLRKSFSVR